MAFFLLLGAFSCRLNRDRRKMGALNHFWSDQAVDDHSKYLIFRAIPCNLLLWGCESWALCKATLKKLEVFLHRNIQKILGITITQVIDERIVNGSVRTRFFNIPTIRNQIAQRQLTFIGKLSVTKTIRSPTSSSRRGATINSDAVESYRITRKT